MQQKRMAIVAFGMILGLLPCRPASADQRIYAQTLPASVWILNKQGNEVSSGSGAVISLRYRHVITNYHVVGESEEVIIVFPTTYPNGRLIVDRSVYLKHLQELKRSGRLVIGRVAARNPRTDLALIQLPSIPRGVRALPLAMQSPTPGAKIYSVGNPGASDALFVYSHGEVRSVYTKSYSPKDHPCEIHARVIETDSATNPGDSGGPVVNERGELVAIVESHNRNARLFNTCIHVDEIKRLVHQYMSGQASRFGVHPQNLEVVPSYDCFPAL